MISFTRGHMSMAVVALVLLLAAVPGASQAANQPDLKIEYVGMELPPLSLPVLTFTVTNVGTAKSAATTATVQTVSPPPPNPLTANVPALGVGKSFTFTYQLPAACGGQTVQAAVAQDNDADPSNNQIQISFCVIQPAPTEEPGHINIHIPLHPVSAIQQCVIVDPDTCPGVHTVDLQASAIYSALEERESCGYTPLGTPMNQVGWIQDGDCRVEVGQVAVAFTDMGVLDKIPSRIIAEAKLTFDEAERFSADGAAEFWRDTDGSHRNVDGCVTTLGVATEDWLAAGAGKSSIANDTYLDYAPQNVHEFVVTVPFAQQLANQTPRWGFVLRGALEAPGDLQNNGLSSCQSIVSNLVMHVTYVVPDAS